MPLSLRNIPRKLSQSYRGGHAPGADPEFFLAGSALVSCSTSTPINHIVFFSFFSQNTSCIFFYFLENYRSSQGRSGVRTPCTLPLDPPLCSLFLLPSPNTVPPGRYCRPYDIGPYRGGGVWWVRYQINYLRAHKELKASPLKPNVSTLVRSEKSLSFDV